MNNRLNKYKYPGAKRLMLEALELKDTTEDYCAQPLDDNLFEWHFTVRGPPDTAFDGGYYHGRLSFPTEYPMKPPSIILLTPNGRFETNKKICLSISGYHPETWQPSWSVRTALVALIAFMPTKSHRAIGSLDFSDAERRNLAKKSKTWRCETCGLIKDLLADPNRNTTPLEQNQTSNICAPSTSRDHNSPANNSQSVQQVNENNIRSGDDNETSDRLPELKEDTSNRNNFNDINSHKRGYNVKMSDQINTSSQDDSVEVTRENILEEVRCGSRQRQQTLMENHGERRTVYSSPILKSIFILLSLLILRRVVMVIQS